jgi:hypothetical protein
MISVFSDQILAEGEDILIISEYRPGSTTKTITQWKEPPSSLSPAGVSRNEGEPAYENLETTKDESGQDRQQMLSPTMETSASDPQIQVFLRRIFWGLAECIARSSANQPKIFNDFLEAHLRTLTDLSVKRAQQPSIRLVTKGHF